MSEERLPPIADELEPHEAAELVVRLERGYQRALEEARAAVGTPEHQSRRQLANELDALSLEEFDATFWSGAREPGEDIERMLARTAVNASATPDIAATGDKDRPGDAVSDGTTRLSVNNIGEFLSVLPMMMGFQPDEGDVVLSGLSEHGRMVVTMRLAQPTADDITVDYLSNMLPNIMDAGTRSVYVTAYGPGQQVTPVALKLTTLVGSVLPVQDVLRVEGDRYWSYLCQDPSCCPPEGRQFQAETQATTTLRVEAGLSAETSRDKLAERLAPPTGEQAEAARQAWTEAIAKPLSVPEGRAAVDQALRDSREGKPIDAAEAVQLAAALTALPVRDHAWAHMNPEFRDAHTDLWSAILRQVPPEAAPAPASLLAFTAWQQGQGAVANLALDRAMEADPDYTMAHLIHQAVSAGLPPSKAILPMTPEQVAQSYDLPLPAKADRAEPEREPGG